MSDIYKELLIYSDNVDQFCVEIMEEVHYVNESQNFERLCKNPEYVFDLERIKEEFPHFYARDAFFLQRIDLQYRRRRGLQTILSAAKFTGSNRAGTWTQYRKYEKTLDSLSKVVSQTMDDKPAFFYIKKMLHDNVDTFNRVIDELPFDKSHTELIFTNRSSEMMLIAAVTSLEAMHIKLDGEVAVEQPTSGVEMFDILYRNEMYVL